MAVSMKSSIINPSTHQPSLPSFHGRSRSQRRLEVVGDDDRNTSMRNDVVEAHVVGMGWPWPKVRCDATSLQFPFQKTMSSKTTLWYNGTSWKKALRYPNKTHQLKGYPTLYRMQACGLLRHWTGATYNKNVLRRCSGHGPLMYNLPGTNHGPDSSGKSPKSVGPICQKRASQNEAKSGSPHPFTVVFAASCERCGDILRGSEMFVQGCKDFWFNAFPNVLCFLRPFVGFVKVKSIRTQPEIIYPNLRLASGILWHGGGRIQSNRSQWYLPLMIRIQQNSQYGGFHTWGYPY